MKKYLNSGSRGIVIGMIISLVTSAIFGQGAYYPLNPFSDMGIYYYHHFNQVTVMAIAVSIWFLIGILFQGLDLIFSQDWSLLRMTLTHFLLATSGFTFLAVLAGWFPLDIANILFFLAIYLVIYGLLYWIGYRQMSQEVHQINRSFGK